ncbi:hypothetical protein Tco_0619903 [Tanacetum coccineum]
MIAPSSSRYSSNDMVHNHYLEEAKKKIQDVGDKLVRWMPKKNDCTAMSSAEAKYVALSSSYAQVVRLGIMPTKIELKLEQSQQGVSNDVLVNIEEVKELKRNVRINGEKKEALHTL